MHPKWRAMDHVYDRLVERAGPTVPPEQVPALHEVARAWLDAHIHEARVLPERTFKGDKQWYLDGPGDGWRDFVLVTHDDPGGVRAAVTAGWFEHLPEGGGIAHLDPPTSASAALTAALARIAREVPDEAPLSRPVLDADEATQAWAELAAVASGEAIGWVEVLRSEDGLLRARLAAFERETMELRATAARLRVDLTRRQTEIDALKAEAEHLRAQVPTTETALRAEAERLRAELAKVRNDRLSLIGQIRALTRKGAA